MTHIPPITREARDWLLEKITYYSNGAMYVGCAEIIKEIGIMPLAPADPLDAVRARFQPKTRGGYEYEIFAELGGYLYGMSSGYAIKWGQCGNSSKDDPFDLLPVSPHAALIAELRNVSGVYSSITADLLKRAADALEARDKA